jgi:hypothetical protein
MLRRSSSSTMWNRYLLELRHALDVVGAAGIPLLLVLDQVLLQIGHGKALADANPEVGWRRQRATAPRALLAHGLSGPWGIWLVTDAVLAVPCIGGLVVAQPVSHKHCTVKE